jgi:hypothetical protein
MVPLQAPELGQRRCVGLLQLGMLLLQLLSSLHLRLHLGSAAGLVGCVRWW